MACYFEEHNCEPLREGETPNHLLHLARLLIDSGVGAEMDLEFQRLFVSERLPPPASKKIVDGLKTKLVRDENGESCAVCLKQFDSDEVLKQLPCKHEFHETCVLPWLGKTNSCPVCRHELPTDDEDYEEYKKQKNRIKQREATLETLHDSMFG